MNTVPLEDFKVNIRIRLALLWAALMSLYIYADYFELMTPGRLERMISLKTPVGPTTPDVLVIFSVLLIVPALMIVVPVFLNSVLSKWMSIIFGLIYAGISILIIVSGIGEEWQNFFVLYNIVELVILGTIIWQAWNWPRQGAASSDR